MARRGTAGMVLLTATLAAGCGSGGHRSAPQAGPVYPTPVPGTFADLAHHVAAINHARGPDDQLSPGAAATAAGMAARLPSDAQAQSMYVFTAPPTGPVYVLPANGGFAFVTSHGGGGGVVPGVLGNAEPVAGSGIYLTDAPGYVFGIASDDVTSVDVVVGSTVYAAMMVRNGYYWLAPDASVNAHPQLRVHLKNGTVVNS